MNKTQPTPADVAAFLASIENDQQRQDAQALCELMREETGAEPVMWGSGIVGFGTYHYVYESGREGDTMVVGFAPRKDSLVLYSVLYYDPGEKLARRLGTFKAGKGCIYIKRLDDINLDILRQMIRQAFTQRQSA